MRAPQHGARSGGAPRRARGARREAAADAAVSILRAQRKGARGGRACVSNRRITGPNTDHNEAQKP
jgi:hypothetical protein